MARLQATGSQPHAPPRCWRRHCCWAACEREQAAAPEPVRPVKTMRAEAKATTRSVAYSGSVKARREATLGFRVARQDRRAAGQRRRARRARRAARAARPHRSRRCRSRAPTPPLASAKTQLAVAQSAYDRAASLAAKGFAAAGDAGRAQARARSGPRRRRSGGLGAGAGGQSTELRGAEVRCRGRRHQRCRPRPDRSSRPARPSSSSRATARRKSRSRCRKTKSGISTSATASPCGSGPIRTSPAPASRARSPAARTRPRAPSRSASACPTTPRSASARPPTVTAEIPVEAAGVEAPLSALTERDGRPILWIVDPKTKTVSPREVAPAGFTDEGVRIVAGAGSPANSSSPRARSS